MRKPKKLLQVVFLLFLFMLVFELGSYLASNKLQAEKPDKAKAYKAPVPITGQTISYATGDDGDLQMGVPWPVNRFKDNGDLTVTDNLTGLMWVQNAGIIPGRKIWADAIAACNNLELAGYADWRLPNLRELLSLFDLGTEIISGVPALPQGHPFVGIITERYCTSTTVAENPEQIWYIYTQNGRIYIGGRLDELGYRVWPVRGGAR